MRPATDLCWTCQKNNNWIHRSGNLLETEKVEAVRAQEEHPHLAASGECEGFNNCCEESKYHVQHLLEEVDFAYGREPCSFIGTVHYSYDYAQQLHSKQFMVQTLSNLHRFFTVSFDLYY